MPDDEVEPSAWILEGANYIGQKTFGTKPPDRIIYLLVAGKTIASKSAVLLGPTRWRKK